MNGLADEEITIYEKITGRETKLVNRVTFNTEYNSLNIPEKRTFKDESNPNISEEEIFSLDNRNRTTQITKENSDAKYTYYKNGLVKTETLPNGIVSTYEYDGINRLKSLTQRSADGALLKKYEYTYDSNGNQTSVTETLPDGTDTIVIYLYNELNMLVGEKNEHDGSETLYSYDSMGNRTQKSVLKDGITIQINYTYDTEAETGGGLVRRIIAEKKMNGELSETTVYNFDKNGSMIKKTVKNAEGETLEETEYRWDSVGMLEGIRVRENENNEWIFADYEYDAAGRRRKNSVSSETIEGTVINTTEYIWYGEKVYKEETHRETVDSFVSVSNSNFWGLSGLVKRNENIYTTNGKGDVSEKYAGEEKEKTYCYDAFGNEIELTADENPYRYRGENYDEETGLIYLRARYYDPELGRFISEDTHWNIENMIYGDENSGIPDISAIMQSTNLYVYCMNNPVNFIDPSGYGAGDHFSSPDEAAKDWVKDYYAASMYTGFETASIIYYAYDENGEIYYTYTYSVWGQPHEVNITDARKYILSGGKEIGAIHIHPSSNEGFSEADQEYAKKIDGLVYVVHQKDPGAQLMVYRKYYKNGSSTATYGEEVVANNLPYYTLSDERKGVLKGKFNHLMIGHRRGCDFCNTIIYPMDNYK